LQSLRNISPAMTKYVLCISGMMLTKETQNIQALSSCDRASWAKYEDKKTNKMQQLDVYY